MSKMSRRDFAKTSLAAGAAAMAVPADCSARALGVHRRGVEHGSVDNSGVGRGSRRQTRQGLDAAGRRLRRVSGTAAP